jgi:hypothetical protein
MGAPGALGRGELDSVGLDLPISNIWRAFHYDHHLSGRDTFELP